jgi:hypothetical protein
MSLRKPLAFLATAVAALALALPAMAARAEASTAAVPANFIPEPISLTCRVLLAEIRFSLRFGNPFWTNFLIQAFVRAGCPPPLP